MIEASIMTVKAISEEIVLPSFTQRMKVMDKTRGQVTQKVNISRMLQKPFFTYRAISTSLLSSILLQKNFYTELILIKRTISSISWVFFILSSLASRIRSLQALTFLDRLKLIINRTIITPMPAKKTEPTQKYIMINPKRI